MKKILNTLFPIFDQLYIFQSMEYEISTFLKWFLTHPFARNLQRKHRLILTPKVIFIFLIFIFLIIPTTFLSAKFVGQYLQFSSSILVLILNPLFLILYSFLSPLFLIISQISLLPIENHQKNKLIAQSKKRLKDLPNLKIVAIVGSFAKTSIKDMLYTLLWKKFRVVKTFKSFNTTIAISRIILSDLKDNTEIFLAEMDAYHQGEIASLCDLAKPDIAVITTIAPQHLERFGSMEKLAATQFEVIQSIKLDGTVFLNSSDEWSMELLKQDATYQIKNNQGEIKIFGVEKDDDVYASDIKQKMSGLEFNLHWSGQQIKIHLPLFGEHHVINLVAAASIALKLGMTLQEIKERAKLISPTPHRLEIKKQNHLTIIDNSYNTNPTVAKASLKLLRDYPGKQKVVITPGLIELGRESFSENKKFAKHMAQVADYIIIVGNHAKKAILEGLKEEKFPEDKIYSVLSFGDAMSILSTITKPETVVLIENDLPDQYF